MARSAPNLARPVTLSTPSGRIGRVPTQLNSELGRPSPSPASVRLLSSRRRRRARRGRSCRSRCSGTGCRPASSAPRSRWGRGSSRAAPWPRRGSPACRCRTAARRARGTCAAAGCSSSPLRHALDGGDRLALGLHAEHQARAHQPAVDGDAAGAAVAGGAAFLGAGEAELVAQDVEQRLLASRTGTRRHRR